MSTQGRRVRHAAGPLEEELAAALARPNGPSGGDSSERAQLEEALRRREQEISVVADNVPALFSYVDARGRYRFANKRYQEWFGIPRRGIIGKHYSQVLGEATRERIGHFVERALLGEHVRFEDEMPYRSGGTRWVSADYVPDTDDRGVVKGFFALVTDITERKRAEEALRENEERFRLIAGTTSDVIWDSDLTTGRVWRSEGMQRLFGYGPGEEDPRMMWWSERIHPEDRERVVGGIYGAITGGGEAWFGEYRFRRADGSYAHVHDRSYVIRDGGGRPVRLVGGITDITERKRAEEALQESEERFRQVAEASREWIWEVDAEGRYTYSSPAVKDVLGYDPAEMVGKRYYDFFTSDDRGKVLPVARITFARRQPFFRLVNRNVHKDGHVVVHETTGVPMLDAEGNLLGYRGVDQDVTDRKRVEAALRESERRYRLLAENVTDLVWTTDMRLRPTYVAPSVAAVLGYSVEEAMSQTMAAALTPASSEVARSGLLQMLAEEKANRGVVSPPRTLELEHIRKDGSTVWLEVKGSFLRDEKSRPVGILGISRDISERKRAETALRESERRYRLLAECATDIIWIRDVNLRTTYVNAAVTRIRGYSVEEVMAQSLEEVLTPASLKVARKAFAEELAQGEVDRDLSWRRTLELEATCKDGSTVWLETRVTALRDENWRVAGVLGVSRDITERKRAEEALQEAREELESRVERRMRRNNTPYGLTFREMTVLQLVVDGKSDKEIGALLGISALTASKHLGNILHKMAAASRTEAGVRAVREGLLD